MAARDLMRPRLRAGVTVDVRAAVGIVGALLKYLSLAYLLPLALALGYGETVVPFVVSGVITFSCGWALERLGAPSAHIGRSEAFLVVSLAWALGALFVSLPYLFSGQAQLSNPVDAYFEAMSGMTTTGATILTSIPALDHSLAMWRQFSQWIGGMGIVVLAVAVLPRLRVGGRHLVESELPGPDYEPLKASVRRTARRLWGLYVGLTVLQIAILTLFGLTGVDSRMTLYEAAAHAFTTMPTGGFSTQARSIEGFAPASQWVIIVFMILAGANFALMFRALVRRSTRVLWRDEELRLYIALLALGTVFILVALLRADLLGGVVAIRHAAFQAVSTMTTTGYASTDSNLWPLAAQVVMIGLMFAGGCAGSTGGAIKPVRHLIVARILRREVDRTIRPDVVTSIRRNGVPIRDDTGRAVLTFVLLYTGVFALGTLLLAMDVVHTHMHVDLLDLVASTATTLGNVGPAFGPAGPMGSFAPFDDFSKIVMIVLMWLGRLEIIPVLALLTRSYWRG